MREGVRSYIFCTIVCTLWRVDEGGNSREQHANNLNVDTHPNEAVRLYLTPSLTVNHLC